MPIRKHRSFLLLTPNKQMGGPEALHQLAQIMRQLGLDARLMVLQRPDDIRIADGVITQPSRIAERVVPDYASAYPQYEPVYTQRFELADDALVILPETRAEMIGMFAPSSVALWWLSVHNGFYRGARLREDEPFRKRVFESGEVLHFHQTEHARRMLIHFKTAEIYPLVDYTDPLFTRLQPAGPNSGAAIAFNPAKGEMHYAPFFAAHPEFTPLPIRGMTKAQVLDTLSQTRIFVEFGHNPGKDRMPREAACAGAVVVARLEGGSVHFDDTPIPSGHKFDNDALTNGQLAATLRAIAADPQPHWDSQAYYRNYLRTEEDLMRAQAKRLFAI